MLAVKVALLTFLSTFCFYAHSQVLLRPIKIGFDKSINSEEIKEFGDLYDKLVSSIITGLDSLGRRHPINYVKLKDNLKNNVDLIIRGRIYYTEKFSPNAGGLFKYKSQLSFISAKADTVIAMVEIVYKDLKKMSTQELRTDTREALEKVLDKIAVPMDSILRPNNPNNKMGRLCLKIERPIYTNLTNNKNVAEKMTHILNNALVFHQSNQRFVYLDSYRKSAKHLEEFENCYTIDGLLTEIGDKYLLELNYPKSINLSDPKNVNTIFYFDKSLIDNLDYYQAIWQLNKSVYDMISNLR